MRQIHYLSGAILIKESNKPDKLYYAYSDFQGSLLALTDKNGVVAERYAYDPWGARRNPNNWTEKDSRTSWLVNRGYTGHEHLDAFGIINMNGRVYDPLTAMFYSPDPAIDGYNWLSYNRYGYCIGNPFKYTDPSGNNPFVIVGLALLGGYLGGVSTNHGELNPWEWDWKNPGTYFGIGFGLFAGYTGGYWLFNPGALSVGFGLSVNSQWGSLAIGVGGITSTGVSSDFNFNWTTSAGGGGQFKFFDNSSSKTLSSNHISENLNQKHFENNYNNYINQQLSNFSNMDTYFDGASLGFELNQMALSPYISKMDEFTQFGNFYKNLGGASKAFGALGTVAGGVGISVEYYSMKKNDMSTTRFGYHAASFAISVGVGSLYGGIPGAAAGGLFWGGEVMYDHIIVPGKDMYWQLEYSLRTFHERLKYPW